VDAACVDDGGALGELVDLRGMQQVVSSRARTPQLA
jgi:hypothetical protein